ncbi:MAG: flagellar biosynthetic protein FliR [Planctomycetaceae bacterium]|nr:flagellar biosynthetic protein FliR [Planctomycetaceae bacterium]
MDAIAPFLDAERLAPWLSRVIVDGALVEYGRFLLVLIRMSGLMIVGPLFANSAIPLNLRVLLTLSLALILTPALPRHLERGFDRLDRDLNEVLTRDEMPPALGHRFDQLQQASHHLEAVGLSRDDYARQTAAGLPQNLVGFAAVAIGELMLGLLLGLGIAAVIAGLQIAGQIVDQQAGFGLGSIINPELDSTGSVSGQALSFLGLTAFLLMEPFGGHIRMIRILVETFETLPVGEAVVTQSAIELVSGLVQQSLVLGIRVAAPLVVMMSLIDLTLGFLSHSVPQVNLQAIGYATRAGLCMIILAALLSGVSEVIVGVMSATLDSLREVLVFPTG